MLPHMFVVSRYLATGNSSPILPPWLASCRMRGYGLRPAASRYASQMARIRDMTPDLSADGARIVFVSDRQGAVFLSFLVLAASPSSSQRQGSIPASRRMENRFSIGTTKRDHLLFRPTGAYRLSYRLPG